MLPETGVPSVVVGTLRWNFLSKIHRELSLASVSEKNFENRSKFA